MPGTCYKIYSKTFLISQQQYHSVEAASGNKATDNQRLVFAIDGAIGLLNRDVFLSLDEAKTAARGYIMARLKKVTKEASYLARLLPNLESL